MTSMNRRLKTPSAGRFGVRGNRLLLAAEQPPGDGPAGVRREMGGGGGGGVAMASTVARDASRPSVEPADADENDAAKAGG